MSVTLFWIFLTESPMSKISLVVWSQMMNHGFFLIRSWDQEACKDWHTVSTPRPRKAGMSKSKIKSMLICFVFFFDRRGTVHTEFVPPGQTVNQVFHKEVLERLRKMVIRVRPDIVYKWMLHHDNVPCHTAISVTECLTSKVIPVVPKHPFTWHQPLWLFPFS